MFYLQDLVKESVYVLFLTVSQYLAVLDTYGALVQGTSIQEMVLRSKTVPSLAFVMIFKYFFLVFPCNKYMSQI